MSEKERLAVILMSFKTKSRIRWHDTDESGRINFASIFEHFQEAEREYLKENGLLDRDFFEFGSHPCAHSECDFLLPLRFDDHIEIEISSKVGEKSITYDFNVYKKGELAAEGEVVDVFVVDGEPRSVPDRVRKALE